MKPNPNDFGKYPILEFYCERKNKTYPWKRFIRPAWFVGEDAKVLPWIRVTEQTWKALTSYRRLLKKVDAEMKRAAR